MRRNVVFDRGRGWRDHGHRFADVGEYRPQETSEYSDAYYGPGDEYSRRNFGSGGYSREQEPLPPRALRPGRPVGRFAPEPHPNNRSYGEVRSFGELHAGQRSWAELGVDSVAVGQGGATDRPLASFRGRGPKGYARSDQRLTEALCERLTDDPNVDASEVSVEVRNGEATLTGSVPDRETKWRVEDIAESCSGITTVHNRIKVSKSSI